jgi:TIR domain
MPRNGKSFVLPPQIESHLATLNRLYKHSGELLLQQIVVNGALEIDEGSDYDNWNGGTYGHDVTLTLSEDLYVQVMDNKEVVQKRVKEDLEKLNHCENEYVGQVTIALNAVHDENWREGSGVFRPRQSRPPVTQDASDRIWGDARVRVFLTHKSSVKVETAALKQSLARCGIGAFVAHEDIEPTEEWRREIERALFSMDALVGLLTEDFHDSDWTDQEVGVALGRGVPLIAVRLGTDPYGLMGKSQGLGGCSLGKASEMALRLFDLLVKRLDHDRMFECALSAYAQSRNWTESGWKAEHLLSRFDKLTTDQVGRLVEAYRDSKENKCSFKGMDVLRPLLEKWTGKNWCLKDNVLVEEDATKSEDIPF